MTIDSTRDKFETAALEPLFPSIATLETPRAGVFLMTDSFDVGGSERQFVELAKQLNTSLYRRHLGCLRAVGPFLDGFANSIHEFRLGGSLYKVRSLQARWQLSRFLLREKIAVAHAFDFYTNLVLIPAARLAQVPAVFGSHRQIGDLITRPQLRSQIAVFHCCDKVICNSRAAKQVLLDHGLSQRKLAVIGNGLPDSAFVSSEPLQPRTAGVFRIGMIARMNARYKNHHVFLKAAARLSAKFPIAEFWLVGDGSLRTELERLVEDLRLTAHVRFLGNCANIPAVLASLDASVVCSTSESLSNAVLESMAAGVPVIASNVGGNPELTGKDRGLLVAVDDDETLCRAMEQLLQNPGLRSHLSQQARRFAREQFTIEHVTRQYEGLYSEVLENKNWRPNFQPGNKRGKEQPVRVAIVAPSRYIGGQAVQAELLQRSWHNDPEVEIRFIPVDPVFRAPLRWAERVPLLRTLVREPIYFAALWRGLKDADVAHIFSASYWSFLLAPAPAMLVARLQRKKALINYRSGEARDHLRRFRTARSILRKADSLVVPSGYLVDVFREFGLPARVTPNIVDLSLFSFRERELLRPHLVCTRGLHPYYRPEVVVRAFAEVRREFPEAVLDLVGSGPQEREIRKLVRDLGVQGVTFAGAVPRDRISQFYDAADIFINASEVDNMPVSILEAFASGTPVVSTAPESMRYLIEHERTGLLSPPGDASALARNVTRLLRDSDLARRIAAQAYEDSKIYRWSNVRAQWLEIYRSLARPGTA